MCRTLRARLERVHAAVQVPSQQGHSEPLVAQADVEFASVTKYYNGHSDVVMGLTVTRDPELGRRLRFLQYAAGAVPSPFDCFLVNRGLKTLHLRMEAHARNASACARFLQDNPRVEAVMYPGLPTHAGHEVAKAQVRATTHRASRLVGLSVCRQSTALLLAAGCHKSQC